MADLIPYDLGELIPEVFKLSLSEACEKYKDWMHHENGAKLFGHLTFYIAMREAIIKLQSTHPEYSELPDKFDSLDQMLEVPDSMYGYKWDKITENQRELLENQCFVYCITPELRAYTVKLHAWRYSTAQAMDILLMEGRVGEQLTPLNIYARDESLAKLCRKYLSPQLNYLKKGNPRFPKKYDAVWNEARAAYIQDVKDIPLADPRIRIAATAEVYEKLSQRFMSLEENEIGRTTGLSLVREMTQTMKLLNELTKNIDPPVA